MWSSPLNPASHSPAHDPAQLWDTSANAVSAAASGSVDLHHCSAAIQACGREIEEAQHLSQATKTGALRLLHTLGTQGTVQVPEGTEQRKQAGAVQWAMERTLPGTEVIMTPELASPFRTLGNPGVDPAQTARLDALKARFHRMQPLYLIFCHEGIASRPDNAVYSETILKPAQREGLPLYEIWLSGNRNHFPHALSGAFILSPNSSEPAIFAIRAAQFDKTQPGAALNLWWSQAPARSGSAVPAAGDPSPAKAARLSDPHISEAFSDVLLDWSSYLESQSQQQITELLGPDAAMMTK